MRKPIPISSKLQLAHERLAHVSHRVIKHMAKSGAAHGLGLRDIGGPHGDAPSCDACKEGKATRAPFPTSTHHPNDPLEEVSIDILGPMRIPRRFGGHRYVLSIQDRATREVEGIPLVNKGDAARSFQEWVVGAERQTGKKLKAIRSDRGGEFLSATFQAWLKSQGVIHKLTVAYTPQQNGLVERWHRTLMEGIRTLLIHSGLSLDWWAEAMRQMIWVKNRITHSALPKGTTPYELWWGRKPDLSMARVWGSMGCVWVPVTGRKGGKLSPRGVWCVALGQDAHTKAWRMFDPNEKRVRITRDVEFQEHYNWPQWQREKGGVVHEQHPVGTDVLHRLLPPPLLDLVQAPLVPQETLWEEHREAPRSEEALRGVQGLEREGPASETQGGRTINDLQQQGGQPSEGLQLDPMVIMPPRETEGRMTQLLRAQFERGEEEILGGEFELGHGYAHEGVTVQEAFGGPERDKWEEACALEWASMERLGVFEECTPPLGKKLVDLKWVLTLKDEPNGSIRHKARLVARGFTQVPGEDFGETFAPVGKYTSGRILLGYAAQTGSLAIHMDVSTAYLNAPLKEEIYVEVNGKTYKVLKALYGLKQAARAWSEEMAKTLIEGGFQQSNYDKSLFYKADASGGVVYILVYVDDLLLVAKSTPALKQAQEFLKSKYTMKDLGSVAQYLGMEVTRDIKAGWLELGQGRYAAKCGAKYEEALAEMAPGSVSNPMDPKFLKNVRKAEEGEGHGAEAADRSLYQSIIGSLMFAATTTRPDLAYAVNSLSQFSSDPHEVHMEALLRALRYFVDTSSFVLRYERGSGIRLKGASDSSHANELDGRSRGAYLFKAFGAAVSWQSKKMQGVSTSSTEAEYKCMTEAAKEAIWLQRLLEEMGLRSRGPVTITADNQSAIKLAHNPVLHQKTKHIELYWHFIRETVEKGYVKLEFVRSKDQEADALTKAVVGAQFRLARARFGLCMHRRLECKGGC